MFNKEYANHKEYILDLFKKDEDCFEYFKERCQQNGVHIFSVIVQTREKSFFSVKEEENGQKIYKRIPYMGIYVANEERYREYEVVSGTRGMLNKSTAKKILPLWYETCKLFNLKTDDYYHPEMAIGLSRIDLAFYSYFTREHKQEITDIITKETSFQPRHVFASSNGYISIVFTEEQYAIIEKHLDKIKNSIVDYANTVKIDLIGDVEFSQLIVNIYHRGMENLNLYGLSRED